MRLTTARPAGHAPSETTARVRRDDTTTASPSVAGPSEARFGPRATLSPVLPDLGAIWIKRPLEGLALVERVRQAAGPRTVTSARREQKAVVARETLAEMLEALPEKNVQLARRESAASAGGHWTLTYYGDPARFFNHGVITKVRMRIRYYVGMRIRDHASAERAVPGEAPAVERAPVTKDRGFLEIKIRNPRAGRTNFVDKLRALAPDALLVRLVHLDPQAPEFGAELRAIAAALKAPDDTGRPQNSEAIVDAMFEVIEGMARRDVAFIRPNLAITYRRTAYSLEEPAYLVPELVERPARWLPFCARPPAVVLTPRPVEFQITVDDEVRAHQVILPERDAEKIPVAAYFDPGRGTELARYPRDAAVVELKEPLAVAGLGRDQRSATHNALIDVVLRRMEAGILWGRFEEQIGKHGSFARRFADVRGRRTANAQIELTLSAGAVGSSSAPRPRRAPITASLSGRA